MVRPVLVHLPSRFLHQVHFSRTPPLFSCSATLLDPRLPACSMLDMYCGCRMIAQALGTQVWTTPSCPSTVRPCPRRPASAHPLPPACSPSRVEGALWRRGHDLHVQARSPRTKALFAPYVSVVSSACRGGARALERAGIRQQRPSLPCSAVSRCAGLAQACASGAGRCWTRSPASRATARSRPGSRGRATASCASPTRCPPLASKSGLRVGKNTLPLLCAGLLPAHM